MRVLLIKTSSLGDVIHALPALTDAARAIPGSRSTGWWRRLRRNSDLAPGRRQGDSGGDPPLAQEPWQTIKSGEWKRFKQSVRASQYDLVIDAQGLLKSAWLTRYVKAPVAGLDKGSAREPIAARFYDRKLAVARGQHAVERVRQLFAIALGYDLPKGLGDYGLNVERLVELPRKSAFVVFLHGTTWDTKHWPEAYWRELTERVGYLGVGVKLPWGNPQEKARAERIAAGFKHAEVLPKLNLAGSAKCWPVRRPAWRWTPVLVTLPPRWMCRRFRCSARPTRA